MSNVNRNDRSAVPGILSHAFAQPLPVTKAWTAKHAAMGPFVRGYSLGSTQTMAAIDTFLAIKNGMDGDFSVGKKVLGAATAAAAIGSAFAVGRERAVIALASSAAALAGGIFRDIME